MSGTTFFHKPELALRRALELAHIHQEEAALTLLHDVLSSRRHRTWSPAYEQIMITYLNLCLKLHKAREAKDGLHQYRNLSQSQAPGSLEKVIRYLMEQAELKCAKAQASADAEAVLASNSQSNDGDTNEDEDDGVGGMSPQAILLSSMSTDPAKNQRDSTLLLPSLKFLWETYRAVLDILRSNSKLEHVYHAACMGALKFCQTYKRRTEFRRLCDMLRMHLGNLQRYGSGSAGDDSKTNNKIRGWEGWSNDSIELHLQTRFAQLETASVLHLYTEGFRTVEDIYNILQISHTRRKLHPELPPPKAKLMAAYYEKLTTLFWVSENHLFHAFAWYKYHNLCKEYNRGMSPDLKRKHASAVLLAALCIPTMEQEDTQFEDASRKEKMARMATLLGFHTRNPTRAALLEEIQSRGIFEQVPEYLQQLYYLLEEDSDPLVLVEKATPLLAQLAKETGSSTGMAASDTNDDDNTTVVDTTLGRYVQPLTDVLLLKLLLNLNSAYHTVKMDHLQLLTKGLGMTFEHVEKSIVLFTQSHKGLVVRMDHRAGCLRFGDAQLESDAMRSQLTTLAHQLETVCTILDPSTTKTVPAGARAAAYQTIRDTREDDHAAILVRKAKIEGRKELSERLTLEKVKEEQTKKAVEEAARRAEEERRIVREQHVREQEKQKKIQREMDNTKKEQLLQAMGQNTEAMTPDEIAEIDTAKLQKEHQDKINKKKEAIERKTKSAAKRLDYLCRAIRIEELPLVKTKYEEKTKTDKDQYEQEVIEKAKRAKIQWESDIKDKQILSDHSVFDHMKALEDKVMEGRRLQHVVLCRQADEDAEIQAEKAKMDRARKRKLDEEKRNQEEDARRKKEEDEIQADDERRRREDARREKDAEEEERRQAELARMQDERNRKDKEQASRAPPGGGGKYVPPSNRGGGPSGGSRFGGGGDRYAGGGRYEGRDGGGDRRDGGGDRGGGDRRGGGGAGGAYGDRDRRDGGGGAYGGGGDRDRRDGGGDGGGNSRWQR